MPSQLRYLLRKKTDMEPQYSEIMGNTVWPPNVVEQKPLGFIEHEGQLEYSRDIGRSFVLGDRAYYVFGDTFCNEHGITNNTYQVVSNLLDPLDAKYLEMADDGNVAPLIRRTEQEMAELRLMNDGSRFAFWCFGGIVETSPGLGWTWYQIHKIESNGKDTLHGVGLAKVEVVDPDNGRLYATRCHEGNLMFYSHLRQPMFGSFSATVDEEYVYLWGQIDTDVYLARMPKESCEDRSQYTYWDGHKYNTDINSAACVMKGFQQGQIFKSKMFGDRFPWVFVGCTSCGDSKAMIGVASTREEGYIYEGRLSLEGYA
ncbi:MAG: hypothetical protein Q9174_002002, partial [Haloplaca sp. 1 TL-2023]